MVWNKRSEDGLMCHASAELSLALLKEPGKDPFVSLRRITTNRETDTTTKELETSDPRWCQGSKGDVVTLPAMEGREFELKGYKDGIKSCDDRVVEL
jgi:hypothetical protein